MTTINSPTRIAGSLEFSSRLEKYLDDTHKGRAGLFEEVPADLARISGYTAQTLATQDPQSALLYGAYSTALSYDQKARYLNNVGAAASTLAALKVTA